MEIDIAPHIESEWGALMNEHSWGIEYKALLVYVQCLAMRLYDKEVNSTS
jgi:hypothetical protein